MIKTIILTLIVTSVAIVFRLEVATVAVAQSLNPPTDSAKKVNWPSVAVVLVGVESGNVKTSEIRRLFETFPSELKDVRSTVDSILLNNEDRVIQDSEDISSLITAISAKLHDLPIEGWEFDFTVAKQRIRWYYRIEEKLRFNLNAFKALADRAPYEIPIGICSYGGPRGLIEYASRRTFNETDLKRIEFLAREC